MSFAILNHDINKALIACGYTSPTPIQAEAIPAILAGKDIVASSQTGSGKTAAFVLPALHQLSIEKSSKHTKILILTPTRELASQIMQAARVYGKFLKSIRIISLVGGMPYGPQISDLSKGAEILIATPGRLMDHIDSRRVDLSHIKMFVLDEADRMLDMGFIDDVEYIAKLLPHTRQTLLFSATVDKSLANVVKHLLKNPVRIDMSEEKISIPQIKQEFYKTDNIHHKTRLLKQLLKNIYKAIIFTATKVHADKLADQLSDVGYKAAALHGDLRQNVRNRRIDELRRGKINFLVATDVAARGIDISDITHVLNFDLPRDSEDYVHRIGRTGRAGKKGIAISFVLPSEKRHVTNIERFTKQKLPLMPDKHIYDDEDEQGTGGRSEKPERFPHKRREHAKRGDHYEERARHKPDKFARKTVKSKTTQYPKKDTKKEFKKEFKTEFKKEFKRGFKKDSKKDNKNETKKIHYKHDRKDFDKNSWRNQDEPERKAKSKIAHARTENPKVYKKSSSKFSKFKNEEHKPKSFKNVKKRYSNDQPVAGTASRKKFKKKPPKR